MTNSANSYRSAAINNFNALTKLYATNDDDPCTGVAFWKLGTSFDTMIDFLDVIDSSSASTLEQTVFDQFNASAMCLGGFDNAWFDDFGWWTVAAQRALERPYFKRPKFKWIHDQCWKRFRENAPFVWERRTTKTFDDYGPVVTGGVWNAYWTGTSCDFPGPKNGNPENKQLVGIQNTVTNALFLMAAQRDSNSQTEAESEYQFLFKWLTSKLPFPSLWWTTGPNAGLVRERVSGFASGKSASGDEPHGFETDWAWTGDQGLMLGNLSDAIPGHPKDVGLLFSMAKGLLAGARQELFKNGAVQNWTTSGWVPDDDESDYQTGTGVFWRNVLHVFNTNSELRNFLRQTEYQTMLRNSADAVVNAPTGNQSIETLTNRTAVLVAATAMLT
jgi:hypothetical protein